MTWSLYNFLLLRLGIMVRPIWIRPAVRAIARRGLIGRVGMEVGVYRGRHAETLLRVLRPSRFWAVDPYVPYSEIEHDDLCRAKREASRRLARHPNASLRPSIESCGPLELAWAYIDGAHDEANVLKDLERVWDLLMPGGVMGGTTSRGIAEWCGR